MASDTDLYISEQAQDKEECIETPLEQTHEIEIEIETEEKQFIDDDATTENQTSEEGEEEEKQVEAVQDSQGSEGSGGSQEGITTGSEFQESEEDGNVVQTEEAERDTEEFEVTEPSTEEEKGTSGDDEMQCQNETLPTEVFKEVEIKVSTDQQEEEEEEEEEEDAEDAVSQVTSSKYEETQSQLTSDDHVEEEEADSEPCNESETEVELQQVASSDETSPTPCPPESPSESAAQISVASSPDIKGDTIKKHELMLKLDGEITKDTLFQQRFFILATNYDEMIKMKDEYKAENERLRLENMQMKMENTRIYNEKLESKERENHKLHQTVDYLKRELAEAQVKLRTAHDDYKNLCLSYEEKILRLVQNLSVAEETLADTVFKLREQELVRSRQERESRRQCERLQKEKNDLMELALNGDRTSFYLN